MSRKTKAAVPVTRWTPYSDYAERENNLRSNLYRAIYGGDLEAAEDAMNLLAMVDIDRELIWAARAEARKGVGCDG